MAVFEDVFFGVPIGEAEIEEFFIVEGADAAGLGAETVDEPREFCEGGGLENLEAAGFMGDPVGGGRDRDGYLS